MRGHAQALDADWGWVEPIDASQPVTISPEEWRLVAACHGPTSAAQLAMRSGLTPDQVRVAVASLAARGLVRAEAATSTRGANGHGSLFAPAAGPGTAPAASAELPGTRTHVLPQPGGAAAGPEPLLFDGSDEAVPSGEAAPAEGPLVFAPPKRDLGSWSRSSLSDRSAKLPWSAPASPPVAPTSSVPAVLPTALETEARTETDPETAPVAEAGPVRPDRSPTAAPVRPRRGGETRSASVPPPLAGAKASPFERRLAKLERRASLGEDVDEDEAGEDETGDEGPDGTVVEDGVAPARRDSSSVVLRMVRSFGESSGRT